MPYQGLDRAFLASSLAFRALASEGRARSTGSTLSDWDRRPALLAAATARKRNPLLLFVFAADLHGAAVSIGPDLIVAILSLRLRKGLGRFSSSAISYSGGA